MDFLSRLFGSRQTNQSVDRHFRKKIKTLEKQLKSDRADENSQAEAATLEELGFLYFDQKMYQAAIDSWSEALRVYLDTNDRKSMASAYSNIGTAHRLTDDVRQAAKFYNKALLLDREFHSGAGEMASLHNLAGAYLQLGEYDNALEKYTEALDIARTNNLDAWLGITCYRIGLNCQFKLEYNEAHRFFMESLRLAEDSNRLDMMTLSIFGMGQCYDILSDYKQALLCYTDALAGARNLQDRHLEHTILIAYANLMMHLGQTEQARDLVRQAIEIAQDVNVSPIDQIEQLLIRARIFSVQGMLEKAVRCLDDAETLSMPLPNLIYLAQILHRRAELENENGRFDNAHELMRRMIGYFPEGRSPLVDLESNLLLGHVFRKLRQEDQAVDAREKAVSIADSLGYPRFLWRTYHALGRLYHSQQRILEAGEAYETAMKWIHYAAANVETAQRPAFFESKDRLQVFQDAVVLLLATGHKEEAIRILNSLNIDSLNRKVQHMLN